MCRLGEGTAEHIFVTCSYTVKIWEIIYSLEGNKKPIYKKITEIWEDLKIKKSKNNRHRASAGSCL